VRCRTAVLGVVPGLVQPLDSGAEAEPEAPARHLVDVEGADRENEWAAREGPGDPGGQVDLLGATRQVGRLRDRGAEELGRPDAFDPGGLGALASASRSATETPIAATEMRWSAPTRSDGRFHGRV